MGNTRNQRQIVANASDDVSRGQENQPNYFDTFPDELYLEILKKLPQYELDSLALVSTRFNRIIEDRTLWKKVFRRDSTLNPEDVEKFMRRQVQYLTLLELGMPSLRPAFESTRPSWCLKELCLSHVQTDSKNLVRIFNKCTQLRKVALAFMRVNKGVLVALSKNKDLEILHLTWAKGLNPVGLDVLLRNVRKLQEFYIYNCFIHSIASYADIINSICENLATSVLRLTLGYAIEDRDLAHIVNRCPLLRTLKLRNGDQLTEISTESLRNLKHLRQLEMIGSRLISPAAWFALATELVNLEELKIHTYRRNTEEMREIEQVFSVNILEDHQFWRLGTFTTKFRVVKLMY